MRTCRKNLTPVLYPKTREFLEELSRSRSVKSCISQRAKIVLLCEQGNISATEIGKRVGLQRKAVALWRKRFLAMSEHIRVLEEKVPDKLRDELILLFEDCPRSGKPPKFTREQRLAILGLACKLPSDFGYEISRWTAKLLTQEAVRQGIVESISVKRVRDFLKSGEFASLA